MSKDGDFLSGFSGGSKGVPLTHKNTEASTSAAATPTATNANVATDKAKTRASDNGKLADKIASTNTAPSANHAKNPASGLAKDKLTTANNQSAKPATGLATKNNSQMPSPSRPAQSASAIIKAPEHIVTKDNKFHKRKLIRYGIIGSASIIVAVLIFFTARMLNQIEVPNFVGAELDLANNWMLTGGPSVQANHEFSLEYAEGLIIRQDREPESSMSRNGLLTVTVSDGPDMDEIVALPDFEEMTGAAIRTWRSNYHMNAIMLTDETSSDIEANHVIRIEVPPSVDVENFSRRDTLTIIVSTGPETVQISNMIGNTLAQVDEFIERNPLLDVELEFEPNETVPHGNVLRQSHAPNSRLPVGSTFTLVVSGGNPIEVPNFANMNATNVAEEATALGLTVRVRERYHGSVPFGRLISQSVEAGSEVYGDDLTVEVVYSLGRPWISEMSSEFEIERGLFEFNSRGANLTFGVERVDSYLPRGAIISQSRYGQFVALNDHINFRVSLGNLTPPEPPPMPPPMPPAPTDPPANDNGDDEE